MASETESQAINETLIRWGASANVCLVVVFRRWRHCRPQAVLGPQIFSYMWRFTRFAGRCRKFADANFGHPCVLKTAAGRELRAMTWTPMEYQSSSSS